MGRAAAADVLGGWGGMVPASPDHPPPSWVKSCSESSIAKAESRGAAVERPSPRPSGVWPTVSVRGEVVGPPAEAERSVGGCELFSRPRRGVCVVCCVCCSELILGLFLSVPLHTSTLWVLTRQPSMLDAAP